MNVSKPLGTRLNVAHELTAARHRAGAIPISTLAPSRCWMGGQRQRVAARPVLAGQERAPASRHGFTSPPADLIVHVQLHPDADLSASSATASPEPSWTPSATTNLARRQLHQDPGVKAPSSFD